MSAVPVPAAVLRATAMAIRERANAAREHDTQRWMVDTSPDDGLVIGQYSPDDVDPDSGYVSTGIVAYFAYPGDEQRRTYGGADGVAALMAGFDPTVAVAVADWLDACADIAANDQLSPMFRDHFTEHALKVAAAYNRTGGAA